MNKKPNILFLMSDQHRHDYLGCVNPLIKTPVLDALALKGVRFSQAICNVPICVPSRYSMMTGLYGFQAGVKHNTQMITNDSDLPVPVIAQRLKDAGYQTAGFGKTHWYIGANTMPDVPVEGTMRGFDVRAIQGRKESKNDESGAIYMADDEPEWFQKVVDQAQKAGPGGEAINGYIGETSQIPAEHHFEGWLTKQALQFLDQGRDEEKPLFLYLSFDYPHPGFHVPKEFEEQYNINDFFDNPPPNPIPNGHRHEIAGQDTWGYFEDRWNQMTAEQRRMSRLRYAALCTFVDHQFGLVIDKLKRMGELENTFIVFTADHGDMLGDRGRVSKYCLYDGSIRVPLILAGVKVNQSGVEDKRPVELVDIMPTLLDVADCTIPEFLPGVSLISRFDRIASFAEFHGRGYEEYQRAPSIMWRSNEWKLILYIPGRLGDVLFQYDQVVGELYHLPTDPQEIKNKYFEKDYFGVREKMTMQVLMHIVCSLGRYPSATTRTKVSITGPETKPDRGKW